MKSSDKVILVIVISFIIVISVFLTTFYCFNNDSSDHKKHKHKHHKKKHKKPPKNDWEFDDPLLPEIPEEIPDEIPDPSQKPEVGGGRTQLINTNWPNAHGNSQNQDTSRIGVRENFTVNSKLGEIFDPAKYVNPVAILQGSAVGDKMSFWTSTMGGILYGTINNEGQPTILSIYDRPADSHFHGSYAFITDPEGTNSNREYFYASFLNTIERFYIVGETIFREVCSFTLDQGDSIAALNCTPEGYICGQTKYGNVIGCKTTEVLSTEDFNEGSFNKYDLRQDEFFDTFGKLGLKAEATFLPDETSGQEEKEKGYSSYPFNKQTYVYIPCNQCKEAIENEDNSDTENETSFTKPVQLGEHLWISNSLGTGPKGTRYAECVYVPTCVGVLQIGVKELSEYSGSGWDSNVVQRFFAVPFTPAIKDPNAVVDDPFNTDQWQNTYALMRLGPFGTGSSPTSFMMNGEPYIVVTDGGFPMGICTYLLTDSTDVDSFPTAYKKVHTDMENQDLANSEQSVCIYEEDDGSVFIFVCNNTIGFPPCNGKDGIPEDGKMYNKNIDSSQMLPNVIAPGTVPISTLFKTANELMINSYTDYDSLVSQKIFGVCNQSANKTGVPYLLGIAAVGVSAYNFNNKNSIDLLWKNDKVCPMSTIPCATPEKVYAIGLDSSNYTSVAQKDFSINLIELDRKTGQAKFYQINTAEEFEREKSILEGRLLEIARKGFDNVIYAGVEVFHNPSQEKGVLVWGSSFGFRTAA